MRLGDLDALCDEFKRRQRAALRWKEEAILADNEESKIRADAVLSFLSEVKLTIDNAPTIMSKEFEPLVKDIASGTPVQTGEWIEDSGNIACSHCYTIWLYRRTDFCPNCGAKMKKVRNNESSN